MKKVLHIGGDANVCLLCGMRVRSVPHSVFSNVWVHAEKTPCRGKKWPSEMASLLHLIGKQKWSSDRFVSALYAIWRYAEKKNLSSLKRALRLASHPSIMRHLGADRRLDIVWPARYGIPGRSLSSGELAWVAAAIISLSNHSDLANKVAITPTIIESMSVNDMIALDAIVNEKVNAWLEIAWECLSIAGASNDLWMLGGFYEIKDKEFRIGTIDAYSVVNYIG